MDNRDETVTIRLREEPDESLPAYQPDSCPG